MSDESKLDMDFVDLDEFVPLPRQSSMEAGSMEKLLRKNLKKLSRHHPELVEIIESAATDTKRIKIFDSESGNPRIVYKRDDGEEINIHSAVDPVECARQAIDLLGKIEKEGIVVLFGFGLGYFAEEVFKRFEKGHILLIYEATPEIFRLALSIRDFSGLIDSDQVKIVLGENAENFSVLHSHHHLITNGKFWIVRHEPSVKINPGAFDNFLKRLNEEKRVSDLGVATILSRGKEFIDAFIENVPSIIRKPGVKRLRNIFRGRPAVIVSAGPSLDKNIHLLKRVKGRALIIATDASIPALLSADIIPDLAVAVDPVSDNMEDKFRDIPVLKNVPFICLAQYTPELVRMYPGPLFINSVPQNTAFQWLARFWEDNGYIECFGGSVAHFAFAVSEFLGANVVAFVGQDLSYSGKRVHASGYTDNLDRILQEKTENGPGNIPGAISAVDIFNERVYTIGQFLTFKTAFESRIRAFDGIVVNATEGGLPIDGAVNMRFADFIDEYCGNLQETDTFSLLSGLSDSRTSYRLDQLINEVSSVRNKFRDIKRASAQILKHIRKVKKIKGSENKDSHELSSILKRIEGLIEKVRHPWLNLLVGYHYGLELYLKKHEIQAIDEIQEKWKMLDKQLERGQVYYGEIIKAINLFNKQLNKLISALRREKEIDSILNGDSAGECKKYYRAGMVYKKAGMTALAVKYLTSALNTHPGGVQDVSLNGIRTSLAEMYIRQCRFYEAREMLEGLLAQDMAIDGKEEKIAGLLKVCNIKIKAWENKRRKMAELIENAEANYGSHLESGYFYFRIRDFGRAEKAYLKAVAGCGLRIAGQQQQSIINGHLPSEKTDGRKVPVEAFYGLAHTYLAMDDPEQAVDALEKALEIDPDNPLLYRDLGLIAFQNNDTSSAAVFFSRAVELAPQSVELYKTLASLYIGCGQTEKAIALYDRGLRANPDNPSIQQDLAMLLKYEVARMEKR